MCFFFWKTCKTKSTCLGMTSLQPLNKLIEKYLDVGDGHTVLLLISDRIFDRVTFDVLAQVLFVELVRYFDSSG